MVKGASLRFGFLGAAPKVAFFWVGSSKGKISTIDNVQKGGIFLVNRCYPCKENEETCNHLLLHCRMSHILWGLLFNLFSISWVLPESVKGTLITWYSRTVKKWKKAWLRIQ